jgi:hypothetical protein
VRTAIAGWRPTILLAQKRAARSVHGKDLVVVPDQHRGQRQARKKALKLGSGHSHDFSS